MTENYVDYDYQSASPCHVHALILPAILQLLRSVLSQVSHRLSWLWMSMAVAGEQPLD